MTDNSLIIRSYPFDALGQIPLRNENMRFHAGRVEAALVRYKVDGTELWAEMPVKRFRVLGYGPTEEAARSMAEKQNKK
jgi:hypothetical protein